MLIPLTEPLSSRYIHINPKTNRVILLLPIISGGEISRDNTCKTMVTLKEFFDGGALRELNDHKEALAFDIGLLATDHPLREAKEERLSQIEAYIGAVSAMRQSYGDALSVFLTKPSNLFSIQLRPEALDSQSRVINPVFTIERGVDRAGTPKSALYNALKKTFTQTKIQSKTSQELLKKTVLTVLKKRKVFSFKSIQEELALQADRLFIDKSKHGQKEKRTTEFDFTKTSDTLVTPDSTIPFSQTELEKIMTEPFGTKDYIDALIQVCTPNLDTTTEPAPFYKLSTNDTNKGEYLSITTQFFLATANVFCVAKDLTTTNFGVILDKAPDLSEQLVQAINTSLEKGEPIESTIGHFINTHHQEFGLNNKLTENQIEAIRQKFIRIYRTVTALKENPQMDDFMVAEDLKTPKGKAQLVSHQGFICANFAEIVDPVAASANPEFFSAIRADFAKHSQEILHQKNEDSAQIIDITIEDLITRINDDEQLKRLPQAVQDAYRAHPSCQVRNFLQDVAKGRQIEAQTLLNTNKENTQTLLRACGTFTDYSGRTFTDCTAYEYAYWAKDTHMCRMLEALMDEETKADLLARINAIETDGLKFRQNGTEHSSTHFDFTPLKEALQAYVNGYGAWDAAINWNAMEAAWMQVGKAQRDVPAHVAQEYCRPDRSFDPLPSFNVDRNDIPKESLPRTLTFFYNLTTSQDESWFPLGASDSSLGFGFALIRGSGEGCAPIGAGCWAFGRVARDLAAITRLDEVRTADLMQSLKNLEPPTITPSIRP